MKLLILFMLTCVSTFAQCFSPDTSHRKTATLVKKDYKKYKQNLCDYSKFKDSKDAKELLCKANYYFSIGGYSNSIDCLKQAYTKGFSAEFKFQILKLMLANNKQLGDNKEIEFYQEKINRVLEKFPEIDK